MLAVRVLVKHLHIHSRLQAVKRPKRSKIKMELNDNKAGMQGLDKVCLTFLISFQKKDVLKHCVCSFIAFFKKVTGFVLLAPMRVIRSKFCSRIQRIRRHLGSSTSDRHL